MTIWLHPQSSRSICRHFKQKKTGNSDIINLCCVLFQNQTLINPLTDSMRHTWNVRVEKWERGYQYLPETVVEVMHVVHSDSFVDAFSVSKTQKEIKILYFGLNTYKAYVKKNWLTCPWLTFWWNLSLRHVAFLLHILPKQIQIHSLRWAETNKIVLQRKECFCSYHRPFCVDFFIQDASRGCKTRTHNVCTRENKLYGTSINLKPLHYVWVCKTPKQSIAKIDILS